MKSLVLVPAALVTLIFPVVAVAGTVAEICVSEFTTKLGSATPLNVTPVAPVKPLPVSVTAVPIVPLDGLNEVMLGATMTVKSPVLVPVPAALVTLILPVVAAAGTVAVI